jgi:hypothetical protein
MPRSLPRAITLPALLLAACAAASPLAEAPAPSLHRLPVCWGYGCANSNTVSLNDAEWLRVRTHLQPAAPDAAAERAQIARALGELERIIGPKTGTDEDRGGTFPGAFRAGQMDCIDESTNTATYLRLFAAEGLLRWHAVGEDVTRGYFLFGWPHTTATIRENPTGEEYAVDSWFFDNGVEPVVIPLQQWRDGWSPPAP